MPFQYEPHRVNSALRLPSRAACIFKLFHWPSWDSCQQSERILDIFRY